MILNILEPRKVLNKAFLKIKANRELLESFKVNLIQIPNSINDKENKRFSKNRTQDFIKKSSYDPIYSLNKLGRRYYYFNYRNPLVPVIANGTKWSVAIC